MAIRIITLQQDRWNGYLLVDGADAILIDCPISDADTLAKSGLPAPSAILHTHVQEEHCREWAAFPGVPVHVPAGSREIALRSETYFRESRTVWPPHRPWDGATAGMEPYSIGGAPNERPPEQPLAVAGDLVPGGSFSWKGLTLDIVALPGHGKHSIGLWWTERGILFSGDLAAHGGYPVNLYDLERGYGIKRGHLELQKSLKTAAHLAPRTMLPATGNAITDPSDDIARLQERIGSLLRPGGAIFRQEEKGASINYTPTREFGLFRQVTDGVYQNNNAGNMVIFVKPDGHALVVDPDPCVWNSWEENCRIVHGQFDLLEKETGLTTVDFVLTTHYHGDHVQYANLVRERYGACVAAPHDVAAVLERPQDFPYPCMVNWYGFPFDHIDVDRHLAHGEPLDWGGVAVTPIHTPGHCFAHAAYALTWNGMRVVCSGDVIQRGQGPIGVPGLSVIFNDTAPPRRHARIAIERIAAQAPDLVCGGHSHSFFDPDGGILRDLRAAARLGEECLRGLVPDGDLERAATPPGFDRVRPAIRGIYSVAENAG